MLGVPSVGCRWALCTGSGGWSTVVRTWAGTLSQWGLAAQAVGWPLPLPLALGGRALDGIGVPDFGEFLAKRDVVLERSEPQILQVNIGLYCNQVRRPARNPGGILLTS